MCTRLTRLKQHTNTSTTRPTDSFIMLIKVSWESIQQGKVFNRRTSCVVLLHLNVKLERCQWDTESFCLLVLLIVEWGYACVFMWMCRERKTHTHVHTHTHTHTHVYTGLSLYTRTCAYMHTHTHTHTHTHRVCVYVCVRTLTRLTVSYANATGRVCSNFKAETSALQTAAAYTAEQKSKKTFILTFSKAALQYLSSFSFDQQIHLLLKGVQVLPQECT